MPEIAIMAIIFCAGFVLGAVTIRLLFNGLFKPSGELVIDTTDEEVDRYSIILSTPFDSLPKRRRISLKVINRK